MARDGGRAYKTKARTPTKCPMASQNSTPRTAPRGSAASAHGAKSGMMWMIMCAATCWRPLGGNLPNVPGLRSRRVGSINAVRADMRAHHVICLVDGIRRSDLESRIGSALIHKGTSHNPAVTSGVHPMPPWVLRPWQDRPCVFLEPFWRLCSYNPRPLFYSATQTTLSEERQMSDTRAL